MAKKEYIERKAFIYLLKETKKDCVKYADKVVCDFAIRMANLMTTADVQEVRHGKWIYEDSDIGWADYKCSACGECFVLEAGTPQENEYNFCPNCGAKMDKE